MPRGPKAGMKGRRAQHQRVRADQYGSTLLWSRTDQFGKRPGSCRTARFSAPGRRERGRSTFREVRMRTAVANRGGQDEKAQGMRVRGWGQ